MNSATNTIAVAQPTANFRETPYGFIACSETDALLARSFLPKPVTLKNGHVCFAKSMLPSFKALAQANGVQVEIEQPWTLSAVA